MDARATVNGVSFNSSLLKGPDMLASLPAVLSNFRRFQYALAADIKEMFHRIKIREEDRQFQRFLWRDRPDVEPTIFVMNVAIFGSTCSPSSAQYVKNRNARDFADDYPTAANAIIRHHYVDDYLDSFGTKEEAVTVGREVKTIHEKGGFEIRNFLSNKPEIAESVGAQSTAMEKLFQIGKEECSESILGGNQETYNALQIHVFVDASESAYSSVLYFRVKTSYGVDTVLVSAKSKVAPLKMLSIPRLELQAAVLGSRLLNSVIKMHDLQVTKRVLWTDSRTVLAWLNSDHRKYHQFVGFRIAEILTTTEVDEWRWIPTKINVADLATKWGTGPDLSGNGVWYHGPEFLRQSEELWPQQQRENSPTVEEIRSCNVHGSTPQPMVNLARFGRWERIQRTLGYVHRFVDNVQRRQQGVPLELGILTQTELAAAERSLWKQAQHDYYLREVEDLSEKNCTTVSKSSNIYKLCPFLDKYGVLRMRGRLDLALYVPYEAKFPTILPQQSTITCCKGSKELYVVSCTENCAEVTNNGSFAKMLVKQGRSNAKRWIALFTCLSIRAIHMEVAHSLSTESCILAIRRFVNRRGAPAEIYSDNGTNFHGANNKLQQQIAERDQTLATVFTNTNTKWSFNPPGAPHMGGVWERMVRSVKMAIGTFLEATRKPDDETLETIIIEAEGIINSRPLTYIPLEEL
ncbi:uncharacterized protein LOC134206241 [Armigeres subalbatus]|uniref:uncharacterized protein LOC134206241 n=1 Tax=Armigeres subalbatus TaxID=124917 RepID=UPI002ED2C0E5